MGQFGIGQPVRRFEDKRLLSGNGRFQNDVNLPGQAHAYVLRSRHAHAGIRQIDLSGARAAPGVLAIEAQERLYYALAGNIALNNCFNARALHAAAAALDGTMQVPVPDYLQPGSFGSLELKPQGTAEFIGQKIDYSPGATQEIRCLTLDSLGLGRIDMIKIDVEGMEMEVLAGARQAIAKHRPILLVEWLKSPKPQQWQALEGCGYRVFEAGKNLLAVHPSDRSLEHLQQSPRSGG